MNHQNGATNLRVKEYCIEMKHQVVSFQWDPEVLLFKNFVLSTVFTACKMGMQFGNAFLKISNPLEAWFWFSLLRFL